MTSAVQREWAATPIRKRLKVLKKARQRMAEMGSAFAEAIPATLARTKADTLVAELLPLLDACRYLERNAETILRKRVLGSEGRPFWLRGISAEVERDSLGHVLVIGPSNFPLFLPGVQVLQALAAGNRVTWKPGAGSAEAAQLVAHVLRDCGLPQGLLAVTADTVDAAWEALSQLPDKVSFTGSAEAGKDILTKLAETATPSVMELSGADAMIVLPGADLRLAANAVAFGLRLNAGATCMSPRRLLALGDTMAALLPLLERELGAVAAAPLSKAAAATLKAHLDQAVATGATLRGEWNPSAQKPVLVCGALPSMSVTRSDIFAPVLSLITVSTIPKFPDVYADCPYALCVSIFGEESQARGVAAQLRAGVVLINDLIAPTADPRVPFGGRDGSGFGVTRGAEGLLEMTATRTVLARRGGGWRHFEPTGSGHEAMFDGMIRAAHTRGWMSRLAGVWRLFGAARKLKSAEQTKSSRGETCE